ncbi:hypothetical protein P170DRAFT_445323 [Aspergillus steynii IBT 23096]|uniref:Uncharacterized protein n=1 Tax=Aspergillus steynii IBT 23096 TaxID=1392250 RepID=A0A2I2GAH3_9EURO|nr:uncharacterized protein P170DRAFT_445323 [Aspergillus steynii IBT 23096]PLB49879.1 hypothetical protein P170DRAFT_445323 [Aspergillus steynii IBT 23096]
MQIHAVSKSNNADHSTITLTPSLNPLSPALTSSNLSYARAGHFIRWWDTYPLPSNSPAPYNNQAAWGIVLAWRYGIVLESTTSIQPGTQTWGFWPTADTPVDLNLTPGQSSDHWIETSVHRQALMPLYNIYVVTNEKDKERMAWSAVFDGIWRAGYLMSEYVLNPQRPIHPLGDSAGLPWTAEDADISEAMVSALAASTKTARSFVYNLARRSTGSPLGLVLVSSSPGPLVYPVANAAFSVHAISYDELAKSAEWLGDRKPKKLVVLDFGPRGDGLNQLCDVIERTEELEMSKRVIIQIGSQQKVYTAEELQASRHAMVTKSKIQYNTSGVQDTLLQGDNPGDYLTPVDERWGQWLNDRAVAVPDMRLVWRQGIDGPQGIHGGWERLCRGDVGSDECLVYEL